MLHFTFQYFSNFLPFQGQYAYIITTLNTPEQRGFNEIPQWIITAGQEPSGV